MAKKKITLKGKVIGNNKLPISGVRVEAWDKDLLIHDLLGNTQTDDKGSFEIVFDQSFYREILIDRKPDIFFKIFRGRELLFVSPVLWNVSQSTEECVLELPFPGGTREEELSGYAILVQGTIRTDAKSIPTGIHVQVFNQEVLGEILLEAVSPGLSGKFSLNLNFHSKEEPALVAKAIDHRGEVVAVSATVFEIDRGVNLDIFIPEQDLNRPPELTEIQHGIKDLIGDSDFASLNDKQLELIAGKTRLSLSDLRVYQKAEQLTKPSNASAEVLYALFRKGLPTDITSLNAHNNEYLTRLVEHQVKNGIIGPQDEKAVAATLKGLQEYAVQTVLDKPLVNEGQPFGKLMESSGISSDSTSRFVQAFQGHAGTTQEFWTDLAAGKYQIDPEEVPQLRFTVQAGSLALGHLPMVESLQRLKNNQEISTLKELAGWNRERWTQFLIEEERKNRDIIPAEVPGDTQDARRSAYAKAMSRVMEQSFPTESLAGNFANEDSPGSMRFTTFFSNNTDFHIGETEIGTFLKENQDALRGIKDPNAFVLDLKKTQLRYMLSPGYDRYESMKVLERMGVGSSNDVTGTGWKQFSRDYVEQGGSEEMAGMVYEMAGHNAAMVQNIQFKYGTDVGLSTYVTGISDYGKFFNPLMDDDPNLAALFGSLDFCECLHCRSIFSAAAYMVDILQFLHNADTNTSSFSTSLEVLFNRRPDLCYIDLDCENTNTPLPYIDLINEIFENAIYSQTTGLTPDYAAYQTMGTAQELLAHPEHIREEVYDNTLKTSIYPWTLPFDLWTEEGRVYLNHLKLPRHKIMDAFLPAAGDAYLLERASVNELLKISQTDRSIIVGNHAETDQALWGLGGGANLVNTLRNIDNLLDYSGLDYKDLQELLKTWFINPRGIIEIEFEDDDPCNLESATLKNITEDGLMNIHRFTRLRSKLGWSIRELDMVLKAFGASRITGNILLKISHILRLEAYIKAPLFQVVTFWGNIFTGHFNDEADERSPYETLFLNKAVLNPVDPAFELSTSLDDLADTSKSIPEHSVTVQAGLGISSTDLDTLVASVLTNDDLNLTNLSLLYRHVMLAKAMRLSIKELLSLKDFTGVDPFDATQTENTIVFVRDYQKIKKAKFNIREIEYLFYQDYDISYGVGMSEETLVNTLTDLQTSLKKVVDENQFAPDPQGETTTAKLATLLSEEDLNTAIEILEQTTLLSTADQSTFVTDTLGLFLSDIPDAIIQLVNPSSLADKQERYEYILHDLLAYLINTGTQELLKQKVASNLSLDVDVTEALLFTWIKGPDDTNLFAGEVLQADSFVTTELDSIEIADFPDQFNTYVLLHKTALILQKFKVTSLELEYLHADAFDPAPASWAGWFSFNDLPVIADGSPMALHAELLRLADLFAFYRRLPASEDNLFEVMKDAFDPASTTSLTDLLVTISEMTKWEIEDLIELSTNVFGYTKADYANEISFLRIKACMDILTLAGAAATDMNDWTAAELTSEVSGQIVHSIKSLYNEKEWLGIARPLRDELREMERSSLVDWLVFKQAGINSMFDLYSYYLVDPEMSACMLTSRIRLALSSIQLFVQRCLMNLEEEVEISNDDLEHWGQWTWMKTYRLWEANRKVFSYPENWIMPEFRDNKSSFFLELEQELEQGEVNHENVEVAYINYLEKLEAVSNMDMMGICRAREGDSWSDGYYIFGRTVGQPNILYFRKYNPDGTWSSWEKIDIDFEGEHLIPIVYNNKLYIFWPVFTTKTQEAEIPDADEKGSEPAKYREIQMAWCVYANGKWSAKRITEEKIDELENDKYSGSINQFEDGVKRFFVGKNINSDNTLELTVYERYFSFGDFKDYLQVGSFVFNPSMKVTTTGTTNAEIFLDAVDNCFVRNQEFVESDRYSGSLTNAFSLNGTKLLSKTPSDSFSLTYVDVNGYEGIGWYPFLFQDSERTYFVKLESWKYKFNTHFHPYVSDFMNAIAAEGVEGLLDPEYDSSNSNALSNQLRRQQVEEAYFTDVYGTRRDLVHTDLPINEIDFSQQGAYSNYNWELFFHIPMLIAEKLSLNQQFEEAQQWYHFIFDPTETSSEYSTPQRFWKLKPFVEIYDEAADGTPASIQELMLLLNEGDAEMEAQVEAWREDPFNPHLIARMRISAYQKSVVMKYIDNLLSWADMLFRQDTMETTNEATQLYMLAWYILGEEPQMVEGKEPDAMSYCELDEVGIDDFSNALVTLETKLIKHYGKRYESGFGKFRDYLLEPKKTFTDESLFREERLWYSEPYSLELQEMAVKKSLVRKQALSIRNPESRAAKTEMTSDLVYMPLGTNVQWGSNKYSGIEELNPKAYWEGDMVHTHKRYPVFTTKITQTLYFCIPQNDNLLGYWDTVKDRMYKLRNCLNIEGIFRQLPLFDPPIDPGALVRAAASGMDLSSALNDLNAPLPNYRYTFISQKAKEFAMTVKNMGAMLLSVLEKRDAEGMALLRASHEIELLEAVTQIRKLQKEEAQQNRNALQESWNMASERHAYYDGLERVNTAEGFQMGLMGAGIVLQLVSQILNLTSAVSHMVPQMTLGASGWAASPVAVIEYGGQQFGNASTAIGKGLNDLAGTLYQGAALSGIIANIQRRNDDWDFQRDLADIEKDMISAQMDAAKTRYEIAQKEIDNHEKNIQHRKAEYEYLKSKFTNKELYDWMVGQISAVYFQAYQMAYDLAKRAERSYKYEIADSNDSFISYGYWDSLKKGLLSGEKLQNDLMRMEAAYLEKNKRNYEVTKNVSLGMINPMALMQLRENGTCYFDLSEEIFDLDHPGQYMRRIKSVSITLPCISGPYAGVNAKLTLLSNSIRKTTAVDSTDSTTYPKRTDGSEDRFIENLAMIQSIATSSSQNDHGLFFLDFKDDRFLPFEGAGAISSWKLELPGTFRGFDYSTISDVVMTVHYTAKEGGTILRESSEGHLATFTENSVSAPLDRIFSMKHEFSNEWYRFLHPAETDTDQQVEIELKKERFPYMFSDKTIKISTVDVILQLKNPSLYSNSNKLNLYLTPPSSSEIISTLTANTSSTSDTYLNGQPVNLGLTAAMTLADDPISFTLAAKESDIQTIPAELILEENGHFRLNREEVLNLYLVVHYYTE